MKSVDKDVSLKILVGRATNNWPVCSLILRTISKIGATRCRVLSLKCTKFAFRWGSTQTPLGDLTALPRPLAVLNGPTSKARGGKGGEGKEEGKER